MKRKQGEPRLYRRVFVLAVVGVSVLALLTLEGRLTQVGWAATESRFSAREFLEPIKFLASDQLKGRANGTPELDRAAKYIAAHFRKFRLRPAGDNGTYLQRFSLVVGAKLGGKNVAIFEQGTTSATLKVQQKFVPLSFSANATVEAPLVFAGYGITAPDYHYDDYQGLDAAGRAGITAPKR